MSFVLEGLRRGAYHEVLGPWVKKILIGQERLKLDTTTMSSLQHGATDLIATSSFYQGNILLAGKMPRPTGATARAATDAAVKDKSLLYRIHRQDLPSWTCSQPNSDELALHPV